MRDVEPLCQLTGVRLLRSRIGGVRVGTYYPRGVTGPMLVVRRHGGVMRSPITDGALLTVQAYAPTQAEAEQLAGMARRVFTSTVNNSCHVGGHLVRGWVETAGPQRLPDPDQPNLVRFQFAGELLVSTLTSD